MCLSAVILRGEVWHLEDFVFWECVQCHSYSLWDVNKDVFTTVGGSDEAMTLWPAEVLTHTLKHRTWVSAYRSAGKDRETSQFLQKPQKLTSVRRAVTLFQ